MRCSNWMNSVTEYSRVHISGRNMFWLASLVNAVKTEFPSSTPTGGTMSVPLCSMNMFLHIPAELLLVEGGATMHEL